MSPRPRAVVAAAALITVVVAVGVVVWPSQPDLAPDLEGVPAAALAPDLPALALDGEIRDDDLAHDSRDDTYRAPFGAVPAGTDVTLRLRSAAGDLEEATIRIYDALADSQVLVPMHVVARDATAGEHGYDYWAATLPTTNIPTVLYYRFIVRDGAAVRYVEDDALFDGGPGQVLLNSPDRSWQLVTYDPEFETPEWAHGAVVYQIFPDRFANGDPSNDPSPEMQAAADGPARYRHPDVYGNPVLTRDWEGDLPEGFCRAYSAPAEPCTEQPLGRDFYGGDLAGIRRHLGELADLGVTVIYLNPIFAAPSNHRYDTADYTVVDPDLGTNQDLETLVAEAEALGIRVLLDGVFNHTSSDSPFFDRNARYPELGACESADSEWADWYILTPGPPAKCHDGTTYEDWFGFDTLAVLAENPSTFDYFLASDGIAERWLATGIGGWRLDVMNEIDHGFLRGLRSTIKEADSEALILGEEWGDASAWLLGTEVDSVMNYRFRRAVIGLINGETADADGAIAALTPLQFASAMEGVREDYPAPAWNALHNLVDSHDTTRILWTLTPGDDNREQKESADALEVGKARLRLVAALQLTWPGMAAVYYGTEAGLTGHDDPDDRRPYPWSSVDGELRDWYAQLGQLRASSEALRTGDLSFLLADDGARTLAFGRRTDAEAAITVLNLGGTEARVVVPVDGWLRDDSPLTDALSGGTHVVEAGEVTLDLPSFGAAVLVTNAEVDLAAPAAPGRLDAETATGRVTLSWDPVDGAAEYRVWRSILTGGGYQLVASTEGTSHLDRSVRNGTLVHYVVTAVDEAGNESARSPEASALPQLAVDEARLSADSRIEQPLSAVEPGTAVEVLVRADPYTALDGPAVGIRLELGFGSADGPVSAEADGWTWSPMSYAGQDGGADRWTGSVRPEEPGEYLVVARVSTNGGSTWRAIGTEGIGEEVAGRELVALPADDGEAPPTPTGLVATSVAETAVGLAWDAVAADDLHRYEVLRAQGDGALERIGVARETSFSDESVRAGQTYRYAVRAQDTSYNRSEASNEIEVGATARDVAVTFTVSVPDHTLPGDTIYIAGDFQGWDPGATPMTRLDPVTWQITLTFPEATPLQYKYTRGSWEAVEKGAGCEEIANRELTVQHGTTGALEQADEVAKWRDLDACP